MLFCQECSCSGINNVRPFSSLFPSSVPASAFLRLSRWRSPAREGERSMCFVFFCASDGGEFRAFLVPRFPLTFSRNFVTMGLQSSAKRESLRAERPGTLRRKESGRKSSGRTGTRSPGQGRRRKRKNSGQRHDEPVALSCRHGDLRCRRVGGLGGAFRVSLGQSSFLRSWEGRFFWASRWRPHCI